MSDRRAFTLAVVLGLVAGAVLPIAPYLCHRVMIWW